MYKNAGLQRKRVVRKIVEVSFDLEVARNMMQESAADDVGVWEELVIDLGDMIADLTIGLTLAKSTVDAIKNPSNVPAPLPEQTSPIPPPGETTPIHPGAKQPYPKEKQKGG